MTVNGTQSTWHCPVALFSSASYVAREIVGEKELVDFTVQESPFDRFSKRVGASVAEHLAMWMGFQGPQLR